MFLNEIELKKKLKHTRTFIRKLEKFEEISEYQFNFIPSAKS